MRSIILTASALVLAALTGCNYGLVDHQASAAQDIAEPAPADDGSVDVTEVEDTGSNAGSDETGTAPAGDTIECCWDADADGSGNGNVCDVFEGDECPVGYADNGDDCDEANASVHPGATETDNDIDDDCDGSIDEGTSTGTDADGDGYTVEAGDCDDSDASVTTDCEGGGGGYDPDADDDGYGEADDCDDASAATNPGAAEVDGDNIDNDCDDLVDFDVCYWDADDDGYGNDGMGTYSVEGGCGYQWATVGGDWCEDDSSQHNYSSTCNG